MITRRCHSWLPTVLLGSIVLIDVSFLKRIFNLCTEVEMVKLIDSLSSSSDAKRTAVNVFCDSFKFGPNFEVLGSWGCLLSKETQLQRLTQVHNKADS